MKYCLAKLADLIEEPRRRCELDGEGGPVVVVLFGFIEYVLMVCLMLVARVGLVRQIVVMGDVPEVDVTILVFIGLTKHPSGEPNESNCSHRNCRSSSGVHADTSSM